MAVNSIVYVDASLMIVCLSAIIDLFIFGASTWYFYLFPTWCDGVGCGIFNFYAFSLTTTGCVKFSHFCVSFMSCIATNRSDIGNCSHLGVGA